MLRLRLLPLLLATLIAYPLLAQDLSGFSICIDPGHGNGNMNRGPTGLREADVNVRVALFLRDYLKSVGADTVVMTRVDDSTNPTLSQREAIANTAGVDWFHSIHHNATGRASNTTSRYTLFLYEEHRSGTQFCPNGSRRGTGEPEWPGQSDVMSDRMGRRIWEALRTSDYRLWLDWSFYGGCNGGFSLGVLNDLQMPGELSEATFHDHPWEEAKLRSIDFNRMEARGLFVGILDYVGTDSLPTGALIGYVSESTTGDYLNGVDVLLLPDSLRDTTDSNNNGVYLFDDLVPGTYTVKASKPGYADAERQVTVLAHAISYGDLQLLDTTPPQVKALVTTPSDTAMDPYQKLIVGFTREMDRATTLAAFSIEPPVAGFFTWDRNNLWFSFEPRKRFAFDTQYQVQIAATAVDIQGRPLDGNGDGIGGDPYAASFRTAALDTTVPVVFDFDPARLDSGVFVRRVFRIIFSKLMDRSTVVPENFFLKTGFDRPVAITVDYVDSAGVGYTSLVPRQPLKPGVRYFLTVDRKLADRSGNSMARSFQWSFVTDPLEMNLFVYDDMEPGSLRCWIDSDPELTRGVLADSVALLFSPAHVVSDSNALSMRYVFTDTDGLLTLRFSGTSDDPSGMLAEGQELGVYVYGQGSGLRLRPVFADADGTEFGLWRTISRLGWQLVRFAVDADSLTPGPGGNGAVDGQVLQLAGLQWAPGDSLAGSVCLDDVMKISRALPAVVEAPGRSAEVPRQPTLFQNYPNPFSLNAMQAGGRGTTIRYRLQDASQVRVEVFNLRGQLVRSLVRRHQAAGEYVTRWDGRDDSGRPVSGGVYLIRLKTGERVVTRKALVLR